MGSLLEEILTKTLDDLKGTKNYPDPVHTKLKNLFKKGKITKKSVLYVLELNLGESSETS